MSLILGIDTSSTDLSIGLFRDDEPMASYTSFRRNSHAEHIAQTVQFLLGSNGADPGGITHVAAAAGPGSFTGLRIGFAFIKGFCMSGAVKFLPVSSLFVLAHCVAGRAASAVAAIDARRGEVCWARFSISGPRVVRETADIAGPADEFREFLKPGDAVVVDTLGYAQSTVFNFLSGRPNVFPARRYPPERGLCCAAIGAASVLDAESWKTPGEALPEYLRSFTSPVLPKGATAP
jgi:tRNA threonylcarbamoyladenosine biosynthesis protein TsaB